VKSTCRIIGLLLATFLFAACSWFGEKKDEDLEPARLEKITTTVDVRKMWSANLGGDAEFLRIALQPSGDVDRIYAASRAGNVSAYHPISGKKIWRSKLDIELSAGPGYGEGMVVVAAADGELIVLDAKTGAERWRKNIGGESLARPVVFEDLVIVLTIDNRLRALSAFDGKERWSVEQSVPLLTLRGSSNPIVVGGSVIAGFDNGRLISVNLLTGDIDWEAPISPPSGRSDLERLADVDGDIAVVGQDIYASGYHGSLMSIAAESGQPLWVREVSSFEGVSADWNNIYTVNGEGEVVAISRRTGTETWRQNSLLRREPTLPVSFGTTVATGDLQGYLHFFNNFDGEPVARLSTGGKAISIPPVVVADRLYVQTDSGKLIAYEIRLPKKARRAANATDEDT
jgi:outer membrane protein assembly factor BamB